MLRALNPVGLEDNFSSNVLLTGFGGLAAERSEW